MTKIHRFTYSRNFKIPNFPIQIERDILEETNVLELHSHDFYELAVVQEGRGYHIVDNETYPISAGNIFFIRPDQNHRFVDIEHLTILNILFDIKVLEENEWDISGISNYKKIFYNIPEINNSKPETAISFSVDEITLSKIVLLADEIIKEFTNKKVGYKFAIVSSFLNLILLITRNCQSDPGKFYNHNYQISTLLGYIDKNYSKNITLKKLASISKMSVSTMRRRFTKAIGYSPILYIHRIRIEKAALLLISTDMSITDIAYKSGFRDSSNFTYQFKKNTAITPTKYRIKSKNSFKAKSDLNSTN